MDLKTHTVYPAATQDPKTGAWTLQLLTVDGVAKETVKIKAKVRAEVHAEVIAETEKLAAKYVKPVGEKVTITADDIGTLEV